MMLPILMTRSYGGLLHHNYTFHSWKKKQTYIQFRVQRESSLRVIARASNARRVVSPLWSASVADHGVEEGGGLEAFGGFRQQCWVFIGAGCIINHLRRIRRTWHCCAYLTSNTFWHPFYGVRRVTAWLRSQGYCINSKWVRRLMALVGAAPTQWVPTGASR